MNIKPFKELVTPKVALVLMLLLTFSVYFQTTNFDFINLDDDQYITKNTNIQNGINIDSLKWALTTNYFVSWQPVTWLTYQLDFSIYGLNPGGYHLTNLIIHILSSIILFFMLKVSTSSDWKSFFITAVFALHPLHVESVAWVAERKDVLCGFFWFSTMYFYAKYVKSSSHKYYYLAFSAFILGIMSKPTTMTLPFVLILFDYWPLNRFNFTVKDLLKSIKEKIPFFLLTITSIVITIKAQNSTEAILSVEKLTMVSRLANTFNSYIDYITTTVIPINLAIFYPYNIETISLFKIVISAILFIYITYFAIRKYKTHKYFTVGWLWYVGVLVPNIGIVQAGVQSHADRYMYIPIIGLAIIAAFGVEHVLKNISLEKNRDIVSFICITFTVLLMATLTYRQTTYWKNSFTVFSRAIEVTDDNYVAYNNLAITLIEKGMFREAIKHLESSLNIKPNYAQALLNAGLAHMNLNENSKAISYYNKSLESEITSVSYSNLGVLYLKENNLVEAEKKLLKAVSLSPSSGPSYYYLAEVYLRSNMTEKALAMADRYTKIAPSEPKGYYMLGYTLTLLEKNQLALTQFKKVLELDPANIDAKNNIKVLRTRLSNKQVKP